MAKLGNLYLKGLSSVLVGGGKLVPLFHKNFDGIKTVAPLYYKTNKSKACKFEVYYPEKVQDKKLPILFYIHGGGWATLDLSLYQTLCRRFAQKGFFVVNLNYELSTSSGVHIEDILSDVETGIGYVLNNLKNIAQNLEIDDNSVYISGDSAGAHLASMVALRSANEQYSQFLQHFLLSQTQEKKKPRPLLTKSALSEKVKGLFLFYGVYNFETVRATKYPRINLYMDTLFGNKKKENKEKMYAFSPINFIDKNFPPTFLASGEIDKLHSSQSKAFADKLSCSGVKTQTEFFEKNIRLARHGFMTFDNLNTTQIIYKKIDEFLEWINS